MTKKKERSESYRVTINLTGKPLALLRRMLEEGFHGKSLDEAAERIFYKELEREAIERLDGLGDRAPVTADVKGYDRWVLRKLAESGAYGDNMTEAAEHVIMYWIRDNELGRLERLGITVEAYKEEMRANERKERTRA